MQQRTHEADVCVVGGGMAGLTAALAAARHGATVVLLHDRPVLGGNASSECRVHICGADRHGRLPNLRETGLLEELRLANLARNPHANYAVWDTLLYEKAALQTGLTLLLNCSCHAADVEGDRLRRVTGWQLTTETHHTVEAAAFVDASGDGILAPLSGAQFRVGREARDEYGEPDAPDTADAKTMGMTCLFQAREHATSQPFEPLPWAHRFDRCDDLPYGLAGHRYRRMGYWWVELGGEHDSIGDTERLRHDLLRIVYGVWDHIKNRCPHRDDAACWALEWVQFLPAKRESRRYVGGHVLTQNDVLAEGRFDDLVAYGGWEMDDHDPAGFWAVRHARPATVFHPTPSPYGIPLRSLYSRNVANLLVAGRCASATHMAMSSARVMGTASSMGQAAGTAAAMAAARGTGARDLGPHVDELQQTLLADDAYLPWVRQRFGPLTMAAHLAASRGDPEPVRDGTNRPVGDDAHAWTGRIGDHLALEWDEAVPVEKATLVLDSGLEKNPQMSLHGEYGQLSALPAELPRTFRLEARAGGGWEPLATVSANHDRLVRVPVGRRVTGLRFLLDETGGEEESQVFAFWVDPG